MREKYRVRYIKNTVCLYDEKNFSRRNAKQLLRPYLLVLTITSALCYFNVAEVEISRNCCLDKQKILPLIYLTFFR